MQSLLDKIAAGQLWSFPGGIHPPTRKAALSKKGIDSLPLPDRLYLPLRQHIGVAGSCLVQKGDHVMKGQPLTQIDSSMSVPVHAPTSGLILAVQEHTSPHPSALPELSIVLEPDGLDEWRERSPLNPAEWTPTSLLERIQQAGIAGMGGAGFPTSLKSAVQQPVEFLIINGVECEPYISADDALMQEQAETIVQGIEILQHILAPKAVLIAIEDDKPRAIQAMQHATQGRDNWFLRAVPTKYPSGGEKQLIQLLTGQEVPNGRRPIDIGCMMFNVGTCFAIAQAVLDDIPLIARVVTCAGDTLQQPRNLWVPLGTPVSDLLHFCGFQPERKQRVIMGGPMMGFALPDLTAPVIKTSNCILAPSRSELPAAGEEMACIRCTACAEACPASLLPQQLLWFSKAKDSEKLDEYNLADCIECGACAYVCPSEIPLVQYYRVAKAEIREQQREALKAEQAKARFEARKVRLETEKLERQRRNEQLAAERAAKQSQSDDQAVTAALARAKAQQASPKLQAEPATGATPAKANQAASQDPRKAAIAAALARAKAKKQTDAAAKAVDSSDSNETAAPAEDPRKAAIAAAVARAKAKKQADTAANTAASDSNEQVETPAAVEDPRKAAIAAAVARAKAKKQAEAAADIAASDSNEQVETPAAVEDPRKAAIAAAVARAKAKKQAEAAADTAASDSNEQAETPAAAEDPRKAAIAAAVARAKAKKRKETDPQ
ncbi:MAG: electron transport complex subunit RsxC [Alkalimonas sp.]|nr:electron transport complex subunit RsxC [Alkalimonas sp.]